MSRHLSCAETEQAVLDRTKTETRRLGWWVDKNGRRLVKPGDLLTLVRKSMGRRRMDGTVEPLVVLAEVEVTSVHREPLYAITDDGVAAEGVDPAKYERYHWRDGDGRVPRRIAWARWFASTMRCQMTDDVTVIRWRYLDVAVGPTADTLIAFAEEHLDLKFDPWQRNALATLYPHSEVK